jgi:hypothetical protein
MTTAYELLEKLKAANSDPTWGDAAKALAKIEAAKRDEVESLIAEFKNVDLEEFDEGEVSDVLWDLASSLDMDTNNFSYDLESGTLDWWVNSYC